MQPNFLFIVADDLNSWIGALGRHPDVRTPNIDALARRGTLFVNAYCSAPYCNASRMGVFTGCLPSTTGIYGNEPLWDVPDRRLTIVELLRSAGYYTFGAGKVFHGVFDYATAGRERRNVARWVERENRSFLWDDFRDNRDEPLPDARPLNGLFNFDRFDAVPRMYHLFDWGPIPEDREFDMPDAQVLRAVSEFLQDPPRTPFFCAAGFYKPHLPWHAPKRFFDLYDIEKISLPLVKHDDLEDVPPIGRKWALTPNDHELVTSRNQWRQAVQGYLAAISYVDSLIGQLVEVLDRAGLSEGTAIVLWGDNGFHLGEKLHWRKFVLWEEATRVPLVIVPPGASQANRVYDPVSLIDIFPTIADMAGLTVEGPDGSSLVPLLADSGASRTSPALMTWGKENHSVRFEHWRYTRYRDGSEELYDLRADPHEWTNLAKHPALQSMCERPKQAIPLSG
ncbi:MAG TPA: sulfatase [Pseudolabrys sp.]|nr:sulfatase [Pseudolabrys sp.]